MGADENSQVFYSRIKGEMENALQKLTFPCLRIVRPSLLLGFRNELRFGERVGGPLGPLVNLLLQGNLKKYRPIEAECVGRFTVEVAKHKTFGGLHAYKSDEIATSCKML
ncbi:hypothetical protein SAMN02745220_04045 [Desulfopila aestuarii DSM 18488]|uniref:Uncharacterized protein n=1 Tax=Desulfopila aestuarii DSM 18488 TaxID=1121416 RepID=A0A1M7YG08_9BACT|nr:hypothetical protein SAMN02745220_04045 [Desulfopila aestuarii DSM 18488]